MAVTPWFFVLILVSIGIFFWFGTPTISFATSPLNIISFEAPNIKKASLTPSATLTPSPTLTFTASPTALPSITPTLSPTLTATQEPTETQTLYPEDDSVQSITLPSAVAKGEHWIDIDLTNQRAYAYQGKNLINTFIISTGTWQHPTITGQYSIYVKYLYADMAGPGYYLPNVPYVMYFYKGYGLHGTYWHNNFGTPMSHGCINFQTDDAGWVYNWVSIGTIVNIHY